MRKFVYGEKRPTITPADIQTALTVSRKDKRKDEYYSKAPSGARLHIALLFYGNVFKDTLDQTAYLRAIDDVEGELKERDLLYLMRYEEEPELRQHWRRMAEKVR